MAPHTEFRTGPSPDTGFRSGRSNWPAATLRAPFLALVREGLHTFEPESPFLAPETDCKRSALVVLALSVILFTAACQQAVTSSNEFVSSGPQLTRVDVCWYVDNKCSI